MVVAQGLSQFVRLAQEYGSNIRVVDVINASDASHFIAWKRKGWLSPYVPEDVARYFPPEHRDAEGMFASSRIYVSALGYNTNLVKAEDAPRSFVGLLDPRWRGKIVKGHPGYSGTIMTATYQIARDLGWDYFEKLAKQNVLQVQSAVDPPKKLALGERAVMADGNDYKIDQTPIDFDKYLVKMPCGIVSDADVNLAAFQHGGLLATKSLA
jgi:iron(III) transport system substrate-binding protein